MAQLMQQFDANQFDPTQSTGGLPIGRHPVIIESSEVKATQANDGGYLQLNLKIIDGPQSGTVGAYRLNLYNSNQTAVEIAHRQMSAICHVLGVFNVQDSEQLHNIPFIIEVGPQKNDPQYTEVKKVFDQNGNEPGKAGQGQGNAQVQNQGQQQNQGGNAWGGQQNQGQNQQSNQGQNWGGNQQQDQNNNQQGGGNNGGPAWGGNGNGGNDQNQQNQAQGGGNNPAWGNNNQGQDNSNQQQQNNGGGWQQNQGGGNGGGAPWGK